MKRTIEALLIATDTPLSFKSIAEVLKIEPDEIRKHIEALNEEYRTSQRAFEIKEIAGGFQIYTLPEFADRISAMHERKTGLSRAALETLAIIAYHQPITRAEIEKVRGVDSTGVLDTLLQKNLVKTCGRLPVPGRPIRYATTQEFLRYFSIKDLSDLPREEDFGEKATGMYLEKTEETNLAAPPTPQEVISGTEAEVEDEEAAPDTEEIPSPSIDEKKIEGEFFDDGTP